MKCTKTRGVSLIALVITIVVMIIISASVILSLSNNGIIGKANNAKTYNDEASLKEYIKVLQAEWEVMPEDEKKMSCAEYVNSHLDEKGYVSAALSEDGEIYFDLSKNVRTAIVNGLKIGDRVEYKIEPKQEKNIENTELNEEAALTEQSEVNGAETIWRYMGINKNGEIEIISELTSESPKLQLYGKNGYLNGPDELNKKCDELYTSENIGKARSMNLEDVYKLLEYIPEEGGYYNGAGKYTKMVEPLTIGEIISKNGESKISGDTPDGSDINTYKADYRYIYKTNKNIPKNEIKKI